MTVQFTIEDVFTPAPSGVGTNPSLAPATGTWFAILLQIAQTVGLPTTSWQAGGPERSILAIVAVAFAQEDGVISLMAQGGIVDFAASGTVTTTALNGETVTAFVTPDPSIPSQNPTGAPGWLDILCAALYGTRRISASAAAGQLAIANISSSPAGPYSPGTYHVVNPSSNATYSNTASLTIPSSVIPSTGGVVTGVTVGMTTTIQTQTAHGLAAGQVVFVLNVNGVVGLNIEFAQVASVPSTTTFTVSLDTSGTWTSGGNVYLCTVANFQADVSGIASNASAGAVSQPVTQATGIRVSNLAAWSAANWESNLAFADRSKLSLGARSPNGPSQAYRYFALTASQILGEQVPAVTLTNGPIIAADSFGVPATGQINVVIASSTPASTTLGGAVTPGCAQLPIVGATATTPIVIQTGSAHGLASGNVVTIQDVLGLGGANGSTTIHFVDATHFSLDNSIGTGTYTGGGTVDGGDLGQVDNLIQENVVPDGDTAITLSALAFPVGVVATVVVPAAFVATYLAAVGPALVAYLATLPLGGIQSESNPSQYVVPYSEIEGTLSGVGIQVVGGTSYVRQITGLTVNSFAVDAVVPTIQYQPLLVAPTINVIGV